MMQSHLKIIVLKTLEKKPMSGYDLVKEIHNFTKHWKPSFGSIYPLLKDLHKNELVEFSKEGRKKVYSITTKGKNAIKDIMQAKEDMFSRTMDNLKNLEIICDRKEMEFIHNLHSTLRNNLLPFKEVTKEMQDFTETMMTLSCTNAIHKNEKTIKKILKEASGKLKKLSR